MVEVLSVRAEQQLQLPHIARQVGQQRITHLQRSAVLSPPSCSTADPSAPATSRDSGESATGADPAPRPSVENGQLASAQPSRAEHRQPRREVDEVRLLPQRRGIHPSAARQDSVFRSDLAAAAKRLRLPQHVLTQSNTESIGVLQNQPSRPASTAGPLRMT